MSGREELAQVIYEHEPWITWGTDARLTKRIPWADLDAEDRENFYPLAAAIITAGYRKDQP